MDLGVLCNTVEWDKNVVITIAILCVLVITVVKHEHVVNDGEIASIIKWF